MGRWATQRTGPCRASRLIPSHASAAQACPVNPHRRPAPFQTAACSSRGRPVRLQAAVQLRQSCGATGRMTAYAFAGHSSSQQHIAACQASGQPCEQISHAGLRPWGLLAAHQWPRAPTPTRHSRARSTTVCMVARKQDSTAAGGTAPHDAVDGGDAGVVLEVTAGGGEGGDGGVGGSDGHHHDDGDHHPPPHGPFDWKVALKNVLKLMLLGYACFLTWVALCAVGLEQFLDHHIHELPDVEDWDISVIIPVLNEEKCLGETLQWLRNEVEGGRSLEVIVVDGGSTDRTVRVAWENGASRVVRTSRPGRAAQMNVGSSCANGKILVFLHADTLAPTQLVSVLRSQLKDPRNVLLGFKPVIKDSKGDTMRWMTLHNTIKTWMYPLIVRPMDFLTGLRMLFGDQVLCCRKADLKAAGGYNANLPIMEDADLCQRLFERGPAPEHVRTRHTKLALKGRMHGRVRQVDDCTAVTSGRRLEQTGDLWGTYIHFRLALAWYLGASTKEMQDLCKRLYPDVR